MNSIALFLGYAIASIVLISVTLKFVCLFSRLTEAERMIKLLDTYDDRKQLRLDRIFNDTEMLKTNVKNLIIEREKDAKVTTTKRIRQ